jgi:two-component system CheB/CheR fusion protein
MTIAATSLALAVTVWERKDAERALHEADRAKDDFLITLSHEIRNPLASVFSDLQLIQVGSVKYSKKKKAVNNIESDLRHITSLLDDLLDLSKVRHGKITLDKEPVEVNSLIAEVTGKFKSIIDEQQLVLAVGRSEKPLWIEADKKRIKQIIINLLTNSIKYSDPGGEIYLAACARDKSAIIEVRDSGSGIDPGVINKIFDTFNQPDDLDRRELGGFGGLGIGLTIVKRFAELHGGSVKAESEGVGRGSKFIVSLPLFGGLRKSIKARLKERVKKLELVGKLAGRRKKLEILVVDDNERAANSLSELLRHFEHSVDVSYSGGDALSKIENNKYRVAILDIGLPDMSGHDLAREIRKIYKKNKRSLLLIALSGYGRQDDIGKSLKAGFDHHLVKPVDIEVIQNILASTKF